MYTKKQKIEIYINFILALLIVEIFNFFVARKGVLKLYSTITSLPWALPLHFLAPIWTVLYIAIAIAGARIYMHKKSHIRNLAWGAWVIQLFLNVIWPLSFYFGFIAAASPIIISILFIDLVILLFYSFLIDWGTALCVIPFLTMAVYRLILHWVFYILGLEIIVHMH